MFRWIASWFKSADRFDTYSPAERLIYSYSNGSEVIAADPMLLWKNLMKVGPELSIDIKVANSPSKDAPKAHTEMLDKIRTIFGVVPFSSGKGLTEIETAKLLDHFLIYCETVKKNTKPSVTSSTNSEDSPTSSPDGQTISSSSDSGSTANEASTESPTQPPSEQPPPSV